MMKKGNKITIEGQLRVKELLKERGMMMMTLAEMLGIARESLTRALNGNPTYSTLKAIADKLGVSVPELFREKTTADSTLPSIHGYLKVEGELFEVKSREDLQKILTRLQ